MRRVPGLLVILSTTLLLGAGSACANADPTPLTGLPSPTQLTDGVASSLVRPSAAINASGQAVVGWSATPLAGDHPLALASFRAADGTWSGPQQLSSADEWGSDVHVAIDLDGRATVAWSESFAGRDGSLHVVRHTEAGFSAAQSFAGPSGNTSDLSLAINASGEALLTWDVFRLPSDGPDGYTPATGTIYCAKSIASGPFGPPQLLSGPTATDRLAPVGRVNARGDVAVVWQERDDATNPTSRITLRQQPAGGAFGPAQYLSLDLGVYSSEPNVIVGPSGVATVTWWQGSANLVAQVGLDGAVGAAQALPGDYSKSYAVPTSLAVDDAGSVTAAWLASDGLRSATADPGGTFSGATVIDSSAVQDPSVAAEPGGGVLLAWADLNQYRAAWRPAGAPAFQAAGTFVGQKAYYPVAALAPGRALLALAFGDSDLAATVGDPATIAPPPAVVVTTAPRGPQLSPPPPDKTPPTLSLGAVKVRSTKGSKRHAASRSLAITVGASEAAHIEATLTKREPGIRKGPACVAKPIKKRKQRHRSCTRVLVIGRPLQSNVGAGSTELVLSKAPPKGAYDVVLTGSDAAGNAATAVSKHLIIR